MSAHQMVCHLSDGFRTAIGEKPVNPASTLLSRTVVKWIALHSPLPWPHNIQTRPEVDQEIGGTKPHDFAKDVRELELLIERVAQPQRDFEWRPHPIFGRLSDRERLRWAYLHVDHHLRQCGV